MVRESGRETEPTELRLDRDRRILHVSFADGASFALPCEYLRVFSPAADTRVDDLRGEPVIGKEGVNIERIEPVGRYAVRLCFDDGHDTGVYSFRTLRRLGRDHERNRQHHLDRLERAGHTRPRTWDTPEDDWVEVRVFYFADVADRLGRTFEEVTPPEGVYTVDALLEWLRGRGEPWAGALHPAKVAVTVNKRFAILATRLLDGDEIGITPAKASE